MYCVEARKPAYDCTNSVEALIARMSPEHLYYISTACSNSHFRNLCEEEHILLLPYFQVFCQSLFPCTQLDERSTLFAASHLAFQHCLLFNLDSLT